MYGINPGNRSSSNTADCAKGGNDNKWRTRDAADNSGTKCCEYSC